MKASELQVLSGDGLRPVLDRIFITGTPASNEAYTRAMEETTRLLLTRFAALEQPYSGLGIDPLNDLVRRVSLIGANGRPLEEVLRETGDAVLRHSIAVSHPACIAHLHCPPLIPSLAAEAMISLTNQSMDSWDQSSSATLVEEQLIRWLCGLAGFGTDADGTFTSGGTQSNLMGLLLARDIMIQRLFGWKVQQSGLPPEARSLRILCSKAAHFTVRQSASLLGLGQECVIAVETDGDRRMSLDALDAELERLARDGLRPMAVVATAGTTDFGSIDPLDELADRAERHGFWLHVDAAYGGALLLSDMHKTLLGGIARADSVTVDFHKLFYQPISCGAFLVKDGSSFGAIRLHADYLNPESDEADGVPNLVTKSIQTTRRFDAFKLLVALQTLGTAFFGEMIDYTIELAKAAADDIGRRPYLQLVHRPVLNAVVFRYRSGGSFASPGERAAEDNRLTEAIRTALLDSGEAVIARTAVDGAACMKFTLLNPRTTIGEIRALLDRIGTLGSELAARGGHA